MNYASELYKYRNDAMCILTELGFFKGIIYEEERNCKRLTIYGFWRIEKISDPSGTIIHKALRRRSDDFRQWEEVPPVSNESDLLGAPRLDWPMKNLALYNYNRKPNYIFFDVIAKALNLIHKYIGFSNYFPGVSVDTLCTTNDIDRQVNDIDRQVRALKKYTEKRNTRKIKENIQFHREISFRERGEIGELPWPVVYRDAVTGQAYSLLSKRLSVHMKMFYTIFWNHMADRELYRAVFLAVDGVVRLDDYMRFSRNREAVVRLLHEKPCMLPALNYLPMTEWGKQDFLSAKRWIRSLKTYRKTSFSFASPGAYRLFQRLSPRAASRICSKFQDKFKNTIPQFMENLVQAQIGPKIPAQLIDLFLDFDGSLSPFMLRLVGREYLRRKGNRPRLNKDEVSLLWRDLNLVCDWLDCTETSPAPSASWRGLVRRAEEWHRQQGPADVGDWQTELEAASNFPGWEEPFAGQEFTVMENITVRPLVSPAALIREGIEMDHCLKWDMWRQQCLDGSLLCYSLTLNTTQERSTLAIRKDDNRVEINQHYGLANCCPCTELSEGAKQVLHLIQQRLKGSIE